MSTLGINNNTSEVNIIDGTTKVEKSKEVDLFSDPILPKPIVQDLQQRVSLGTKPICKSVDLFAEIFLPKRKEPSFVDQDQIQKLQELVYTHALEKRFGIALTLAETMPLDSTAKATALGIIADLASLPDEANHDGDFVLAEKIALKISDVHMHEKSTALYRIAMKMKNSQKGEWRRVAESIPDKKIRSFILPEKIVIQSEKPQPHKTSKLTRVMSSADLLPGTSQLSSASYIMPVRLPQKSHNTIPKESSYNHLPSINDLCGDSAEPNDDEGESELACDPIGFSLVSRHSPKLIRQGNSSANFDDSCEESAACDPIDSSSAQPVMLRKLVRQERTFTDLSDALHEDKSSSKKDSGEFIFQMSEDEEERTVSPYPLKKS